mgnify:CR=1 FL=1
MEFVVKVVNIIKINKMAKENELKIIEDCAHAIGTRYNKKHVGNFGSAGCFSFYPTKNITTIEGGMVITNSKNVAKYVMAARNHGLTKTLTQRYSHGKPWDYDVDESGYNYRLDEIKRKYFLFQFHSLPVPILFLWFSIIPQIHPPLNQNYQNPNLRILCGDLDR